MAANVQITDNALVVDGVSTPLSKVLTVDAQHVDELVRGTVIFILCCFGPIIAMITGTIFDGPGQEALRWISTIITGPGFVAAGIAISFAWKKPWAVVYEVEAIGYKAIRAEDEEKAKSLAGEISKALS